MAGPTGQNGAASTAGNGSPEDQQGQGASGTQQTGGTENPVLAQLAKAETELAKAQAFIGRQSTEIGDLRKMSDNLSTELKAFKANSQQQGVTGAGTNEDQQGNGQGTTGPQGQQREAAASQGASGQGAQGSTTDILQSITVTEQQTVDQAWRNLSNEERAVLVKDAPGETQAIKLEQVKRDLLGALRENMVIVPESLFGQADPTAVGNQANQAAEGHRARIIQAIFATDRTKHRPLVSNGGTSAMRGQGQPFTPVITGTGVRQAEPKRIMSGDGGVLSMMPKTQPTS